MCGQRGWSRRGGSTIASVGVAIVLFLSLRAEVVRGEERDVRQTSTGETQSAEARPGLDVTDYDRLLHTYLTDDGWADYAGLVREASGENTPTIYPPLSEFAYRRIETVLGYKRVSTILDLASVGVLMQLLAAMKQPLHRVLTYAWNPTVLISFAMCGHFDSLAIVTLLTALLFLVTNRPAFCMGALALSFLSKFFPAMLLPTFLKRVRLAHVGLFVFLVFTFYLPFLRASLHLGDGLRDYARVWENNASLFHLLYFVAGSRTGAELVAGLMVLAAIGYLAKRQTAPLWWSLLLTGGVLLLSPTAYPWYFTWSIPFLCFYPSAAWLLMRVTTVLAYTPPIAYGAGEPLKNSLLMLSLEYGPVYLWLAYYCWSGCRPKIFREPLMTAAS